MPVVATRGASMGIEKAATSMGLKGEAAPLASWLVRAVMAAAVTVGAALAAPHVVLDVRAAYLLGCGVVASAAIGVGAAWGFLAMVRRGTCESGRDTESAG